MTTPKNKPRGYFQYILAVDCETTGLCFKNYDNKEDPVHNPTTGERHQAVSWGIMVIRADTFKPVEKLYVEIKWNENSIKQREQNPSFGKKAEEVHGLTRKYLEENGVSEEDAVVMIGELILKYFGPENPIKLLGHNVHLFDLAFLRDMFYRHGVVLHFGNRHYDTNSSAFMTFGTWNSDDLFTQIGYDTRKNHNSLEDIEMTVEAARVIRLIFQNALKE